MVAHVPEVMHPSERLRSNMRAVNRSFHILRVAWLLAWAAVGFEVMSAAYTGSGTHLLREHRWLELAVPAAFLVAFGLAALWITGPGLRGRHPRILAALLLLESVIGTFLIPDLAYLVAIVLPFVLNGVRRIPVRSKMRVTILRPCGCAISHFMSSDCCFLRNSSAVSCSSRCWASPSAAAIGSTGCGTRGL